MAKTTTMEKKKFKASTMSDRLKATEIPESGIVIIPLEIHEYQGTFRDREGNAKPFWVLSSVNEDGDSLDISFGTKRLHEMLVNHWDDIKDKKMLICGFGSDPKNRKYTIEEF